MGAMLRGKTILEMDNILLKLSSVLRGIFRLENEAPTLTPIAGPQWPEESHAEKPPTITRWIAAA